MNPSEGSILKARYFLKEAFDVGTEEIGATFDYEAKGSKFEAHREHSLKNWPIFAFAPSP